MVVSARTLYFLTWQLINVANHGLRLLPIVTITAFLYAGTIAPRTELLVKLACNDLHPDWDLVSNTTIMQKNATAASTSSHSTRDFPMRLYFVERSAHLASRSQITTPGTSPMCSNDADVQKAVAKLNTAITTTSGILSVLTTGWWTQVSALFYYKPGQLKHICVLAVGPSGTGADPYYRCLLWANGVRVSSLEVNAISLILVAVMLFLSQWS